MLENAPLKTDLIIKLIGTQDVHKWDEEALLNWATKMAELMVKNGQI